MAKYDVYIEFSTIFFKGIEANSVEEAEKIATDKLPDGVEIDYIETTVEDEEE